MQNTRWATTCSTVAGIVVVMILLLCCYYFCCCVLCSLCGVRCAVCVVSWYCFNGTAQLRCNWGRQIQHSSWRVRSLAIGFSSCHNTNRACLIDQHVKQHMHACMHAFDDKFATMECDLVYSGVWHVHVWI